MNTDELSRVTKERDAAYAALNEAIEACERYAAFHASFQLQGRYTADYRAGNVDTAKYFANKLRALTLRAGLRDSQ